MKCHWYQFCLAVRRKAQTFHGFYERSYDDKDADILFHKFLCLPFVSEQRAKQAYDFLSDKAQAFDIFRAFIVYFKKVWIEREGSKNFCIDWDDFGKPYSFNYNESLKKKFCNSNSKCSFYNYIKIVKKEFEKAVADFETSDPIKHPQSRQTQFIKKEHALLEDSSIDIQQFLNHLTFDDNGGSVKYCNSYNIGDENEVDVDDDENYEGRNVNEQLNEIDNPDNPDNQPRASQSETCVVCLTRPKNTMLLPCNHIRFCAECVEILMEPREDDYGMIIITKCPICRTVITGHTRVYLWYNFTFV